MHYTQPNMHAQIQLKQWNLTVANSLIKQPTKYQIELGVVLIFMCLQPQ